MSAYAFVVTSPATWTRPVVTIVSTATRLVRSCDRRASRMLSLIWSQILSGCPSVTDSEVKRRSDTALLNDWATVVGRVQRLLAHPRARLSTARQGSGHSSHAREVGAPPVTRRSPSRLRRWRTGQSRVRLLIQSADLVTPN